MPALERLEVLGDTHALDCISALNLVSLKIKSDLFTIIRSDHIISPILEFLPSFKVRSAHVGYQLARHPR